jgi:catechol 2,3-dioxygenase-like lactoylglutathione lyase family enzyme
VEYIIGKLLRDFEQGKMNRRQLIQSLALAASAAGAAQPALAAAEGSPFKAVTVNHISYQVADYTKTRDFYADLFGMKVSHDDGRQAYLAFGDTFIIPRNARSGVTPPRVDHIAYTIDKWDKNAVEAELKRRGLQPRPDTEDSFHVKDPDGFDLQISGKGMKA